MFKRTSLIALVATVAACTGEVSEIYNPGEPVPSQAVPPTTQPPVRPDVPATVPNSKDALPPVVGVPLAAAIPLTFQPTTPITPVVQSDIFVGLPRGAAQLAILCARGNGDPISLRLCAPHLPAITSLIELQKVLGLDFKPGQLGNGQGGNPAFVLTGHSSSLVTRFVSAINPRALIFTPPASNNRVGTPVANPNFIGMGFVRGEQFAELVAKDPKTNDLNFFLVSFEHACSATNSCAPADLLTPDVEKNFTNVTVFQDIDIKNTVFDCLQCHQAAGAGSKKILRMQELQNPWTHFFRNNRPGGQAMIADYNSVHGTQEVYAGIPGAAITNSDPGRLEGLVENEGFKNQPNEFLTSKIEAEVLASGTTPGTSATWNLLYANVLNGSVIPVPYHDVRVTDPAKVTAAATNYKAVMAGTLPRSSLMDFRSIFNGAGMSDMSFQPKASLDGRGIMVAICQHCHNAVLDQTISRARFDVTKLATMTRDEKDIAIARLQISIDDRRKMPPSRFATLSPAQIQLAIDELKK